MAKTLDRSRDFGEVCGAGVARYEQDGALFDADGKKIKATSIGSAATAADVADEDDDSFPEPPAPVANEAASDTTEIDEQLAAQGML